MELSPEQRAQYRAALEGNPVYQELRIRCDILHERNLILMNIARDHCPDRYGSLYIHMQPHRMAEDGAAAKTTRVAPNINIDYDSNGQVYGVEILDVPALASAAAMDAVSKDWRNG